MNGLVALVGGNEFRAECESMDCALLARLGPQPHIAILPTAAAHENPVLAGRNGVAYFRRLGAQAESVMIIDPPSARDPALTARLRDADAVYIAGGDPVYLLETLKDSPAWMAIREVPEKGGLLAGSSAGAMICGGMMWAPGAGWREGLGLFPQLAVLPHHASLARKWNAGRLRKSLPPQISLIGIDEATAIFGPPWKVIGAGQAVLYLDQGTSVFTEGQIIPL